MPSRKVWDQYGINHIKLTICGWIDILARKDYKDMIIESLDYCQEHNNPVKADYVYDAKDNIVVP
jgi:hypothetical protein